MKKAHPLLRKIGRTVAYLLYLGFTVLFLLELAYRTYIFDFYAGNLHGLNETAIIDSSEKPALLAIGDSFTADRQSYLSHLGRALPGYRIINSAVPGTCIRQHALITPRRVRQFKPDIFLYQVYVGNDLFEFHRRTDSPKISRLRKWYWWLADRILVLGYINAKLPNIRQALFQDLPVDVDAKALREFSAETYSHRSKLLFQAEANLIENTATLAKSRKSCMEAFTKNIANMIEKLPADCKVVLLVLPHCMQLGSPYLGRMQAIGAKISDPESLTAYDYPFYRYLKDQLPNDRIHFVNPLNWLSARDSISNVYYNNDPHLNAEGHKLIGTKLAELLQKEGIFD